jgi:hypothetical protein
MYPRGLRPLGLPFTLSPAFAKATAGKRIMPVVDAALRLDAVAQREGGSRGSLAMP